MAPSPSSSSSSKSIHETIQMMMKYIQTGDASDLGELGEYLGLTPSSNSTTLNPILNPASSTTSTTSTTLKAVQKPTNPIFKLPIAYLPEYDRHPISTALSDDLELVASKDAVATRPLYESLFFPTSSETATIYAKQYLYMWGETFTTNVTYLKNTQEFIARFCKDTDKVGRDDIAENDDVQGFTKVDEFWNTMKTNRVGFKDKFGYFDVPPLPIIEKVEQLNHVPTALQILSVYNVSTPLISLCMPILILILPFFIIRSRGIDINVDKYIEVLKGLASSHAIGKLFTEFSSVSMERRMYLLMSVIFYIMQVYQNCMSCWRFYKNIYTIHDHLILARDYLVLTAKKMETVLRCCASLEWYRAFCGCMEAELQNIRAVCAELEDVQPFSLSLKAVAGIGHVMKHYYAFFKDESTDAMMRYSFGFNAFYEHICGVAHHITAGVLNPCSFTDANTGSTSVDTSTSASTTSMQDAYFLNTSLSNASSEIVKNDIVLDKKLIITGPNAAGKTTIIKTTLFNVLLSQQFGYGVYKTATIVPYHFLHCYLNIPDTSGRDSLFQAESRRCKEILDCITTHASKRHFGIFDELYSGTNPYEAVASAYGYIHHISEMKNVDFMLTTHYIHLCELFEPTNMRKKKKHNHKHKHKVSASASSTSSKETKSSSSSHSEKTKIERLEEKDKEKDKDNHENRIRNLHMKTTVGESGTDHVYHYKVEEGISKVRGGIKVLVDLKYPDSIIQTTKRILTSDNCV
jgi:hypothetical protein